MATISWDDLLESLLLLSDDEDDEVESLELLLDDEDELESEDESLLDDEDDDDESPARRTYLLTTKCKIKFLISNWRFTSVDKHDRNS